VDAIEGAGVDQIFEDSGAFVAGILRQVNGLRGGRQFAPTDLPNSQARFRADGDLAKLESQAGKIADGFAVVLDADL